MKKWIALILLLPAVSFAAVTRSYNFLPFSNGLGAAVYQAKEGSAKLLYLYDHIYKAYKQGQASQSLLRKNLQFGLNGMWLEDAKLVSAEYVTGTGIVKAVKTMGTLVVTEYYFMPMNADGRIFVSVLEVSNTGGAAQACAAYYYNDVGIGGPTAKENVTADNGLYTETRATGSTGYSWMMFPAGAQYVQYLPGELMTNGIKKAPMPITASVLSNGKQVAGIVQFPAVTLAAGTVKRYVVVTALADRGKEAPAAAAVRALAAADGAKLLADETAAWTKWHSVETLPAGLAPDEKRLFLQSMAILRMGQCREAGSSCGQILASMPPGEWNISWPRDGAYSIVALVRSGHTAEAKAALEFMLNAPNGNFTQTNFVGVPYKISVCRYWGGGGEESDLNGSGPNLEWDDFGLFLWAFSEYVKKSGDTAFLTQWYPVAKTLVADVLVHLMTPDGYLVRDSSIWERHWEPQGNPDGRKFFAYSTINAWNGLLKFSQVCPSDSDKAYYKQMAAKVKAGFLANFLSDGIVVSSLEEKAKGPNFFMDAAGVEAINHGLVDSDVAKTTLAAYEKFLKMKNSPGFFRNDDGTWYDKQEWVMIDLRVASAYVKQGNLTRAKELYRWVVDNAAANFYLIPELLEESNNAFKGAIPMCGFGAGAFIITSYDLAAAR